jgi:hypothetical protein
LARRREGPLTPQLPGYQITCAHLPYCGAQGGCELTGIPYRKIVRLHEVVRRGTILLFRENGSASLREALTGAASTFLPCQPLAKK